MAGGRANKSLGSKSIDAALLDAERALSEVLKDIYGE